MQVITVVCSQTILTNYDSECRNKKGKEENATRYLLYAIGIQNKTEFARDSCETEYKFLNLHLIPDEEIHFLSTNRRKYFLINK